MKPATLLKIRLWQRGFPVNFAKILKRIPFLQKIYLEILAGFILCIYNGQLSISKKSLFKEKNSSIYLKDFTDFFHTDVFFFISFAKWLFTLPVK